MKNKAKTRCREKRRVLDRLGLRVEVDDDFSMVADNVTPEHIYIEKETGEGLRRGIVRLIGEDGYAILRALTKPTTARIALIYKKSEAILASGGGFAEPFGIVKSSRPWRQILPQAKFPRQLHLHPAVTYVHVSSLGCKYSFLGVDLPSPTGSSNPVAFGDKFCRWQNFLACGLSQRSASLLTLSTS